eukprot:scaffold18659_cov106-Isochrysis_galbana.AAC.3
MHVLAHHKRRPRAPGAGRPEAPRTPAHKTLFKRGAWPHARGAEAEESRGYGVRGGGVSELSRRRLQFWGVDCPEIACRQ